MRILGFSVKHSSTRKGYESSKEDCKRDYDLT